jgi:hypothetical protein
VQANAYSVALNTDNKAVDPDAASFTSHAEAVEYMNGKIANDRTLADQLHVIPAVELQEAA